VAALIERATGVTPYFVGKPNPLMITEALLALGAAPSSTAIVGDRMETDVAAGVGAGLETILVLSGVTSKAEVDRYPYRPSRVVDSVADLVAEL
jgi:NagD protein